ncbi:hypothetical protein FGB62_260g012 [Gracilaria domingensis]|nr:hypothetical protein FGB62_260g012 [Gracilaria domingensis]
MAWADAEALADAPRTEAVSDPRPRPRDRKRVFDLEIPRDPRDPREPRPDMAIDRMPEGGGEEAARELELLEPCGVSILPLTDGKSLRPSVGGATASAEEDVGRRTGTATANHNPVIGLTIWSGERALPPGGEGAVMRPTTSKGLSSGGPIAPRPE